MTRLFAVDTNCMIAVISTWEKRHPEASAEIEARLSAGERMTVSVQALSEAYSVLTRLPATHRLSPADAMKFLDAMFVRQSNVVTLDAQAHVDFLRRMAVQGIAGGRIYDAIIGECARIAGATTLLTFNLRDFDPAPQGVTVIEPSA